MVQQGKENLFAPWLAITAFLVRRLEKEKRNLAASGEEIAAIDMDRAGQGGGFGARDNGDRHGVARMRADALPEIDRPAIVCMQHGNVNSGAFDPAAPIVAWARARNSWVHVDGAFGLWARAAPARAAQ